MQNNGENEIPKFHFLCKNLDEIYHDMALKMEISDSAFTIFQAIGDLGDGCLQKDICIQTFSNKQTINSSIRRLEQEGYIYFLKGTGRDKHIHLTKEGKRFMQENIRPIKKMEKESFLVFTYEEQREFLRLTQKYVENFREKAWRLI